MRKFEGFQKGINLGGWLSQCEHTKKHYDTFIKEEDIANIAKWGLDHIRVPVDYELIQEEDGSYIEEGFSYLDTCIRWCRKYHLNMVLDLHKTKGYSFDFGENENGFFENEALQIRFVHLWKEFTRRYRKEDDMLAFELLNEVVDPNVAEQWNNIIRLTIEEIRKTAKKIHIIVGGVCNNSVTKVKLLDAPYDKNVVYNFHCYDPLIFTHQSAQWVPNMPSDFRVLYPASLQSYQEAGQMIDSAFSECLYVDGVNVLGQSFFETIFKEAIEKAEDNDAMLYCGEYGVINQAPVDSTLKWYQDIHGVFEKYNIGRAAWSYKEMDFGITEKHYETIQDDLIDLL